MLVSTLLAWDAATLAVQGSVLDGAAVSIADTGAAVSRIVGRTLFLDRRWHGDAASAAGTALERRSAATAATAAIVSAASDALRSFANAIDAAQLELRAGLALAGPRVLVHDDGTVEVLPLPAAPEAYDSAGHRIPNPQPNPADDAAAQYGRVAPLVRQAIADADAADARCAATLDGLRPGIEDILTRFEPDVMRGIDRAEMPLFAWLQWTTTVPSPGTAPRDAQRWWADLDTNARTALLRDDPELLGNLDGLPPEVRNAANRRALIMGLASTRDDLAQVNAWLAAHDTGDFQDDTRLATPTEVRDRMARHQELVRLLAWYEHISADLESAERMHEPTRNPYPIQLLIMDPHAFDGDGRAALAFGDVATAANVTYVVPGLNQYVNPEFGRTIGNAFNVQVAAHHADKSSTFATEAWLGYHSPDWSEVGFDGRAGHGAEELAAELRGLQAVRRFNDPHLTVIGHSYGSTTVGYTAMRHADLGIDDLILVGSPGTGADRASDLQVPAGHVWVGAASGDAVDLLRNFGSDPADGSFGAHRFSAESDGRNSVTVTLGEHSRYFTPDTESLYNIGNIVNGWYDSVVTAAGRYYYAPAVPAADDSESHRPVTHPATH